MARHYDEMSHWSRGRVSPEDALKLARRKFLKRERVDMIELAAELGVGRATLYRWHGSRDHLIGEVLWSMAQIGLQRAREEAKGRGVNWVMAVYERFGDFIVETPAIRYFVETEPEAALRVLTTKSADLQGNVVATFADILVEAQERKGLQLRLDPETLAYVIVRIAESFLWTDLITGEEPQMSKASEVARVLLS